MKLIEKHYEHLNILGLFVDNKPILFKIRRENALNYGEITPAKITQKNDTLRGYFVETTDKYPVFIPTKEKFSIGETVYIQITKEARLGKDATGVIINDNEIKNKTEKKPDDFSLFDDILCKITNKPSQPEDDNIISANLIEEVLETDFSFADGAKLHLERTAVCWTFDVDSAQSSLPLSVINEKACMVIAEQILLKNLSGLILIDFAGYKNRENEEKYLLMLHQYLHNDSRTKIFGFTRAKLCEIRRTRTTASLFDIFLTSKGKKNAIFLCMEIEDRLKGRFVKIPELYVHPSLIPHLTSKIKNQCLVKTDCNLCEDTYILKGE